MKIKLVKNNKTFNDLKMGDKFLLGNSKYLKTNQPDKSPHTPNCVNLNTGELGWMDEDQYVQIPSEDPKRYLFRELKQGDMFVVVGSSKDNMDRIHIKFINFTAQTLAGKLVDLSGDIFVYKVEIDSLNYRIAQ